MRFGLYLGGEELAIQKQAGAIYHIAFVRLSRWARFLIWLRLIDRKARRWICKIL
jgi:hypothetical protein